MAFKHYDLVSASSGDELQKKLTEKISEGWQPYGSPFTSYDDNGMKIIQAVAAEGDVRVPVEVPDDSGDDSLVAVTGEPDYYYVIPLAGQSNGMACGEGIPLPQTADRPDPRIKQLARRSAITPGGSPCTYNDIIAADHCLHDVQDMSGYNHPKADLGKGQYGTVGQGLHIAKKLLPFIPLNAGILLVPCCRGGSSFSVGDDGTFSENTGASEDSSRWGAGKPLYQDLLFRTKAALSANPKNRLLAVVWVQGEGDLPSGSQQHGSAFTAMVSQFRTDLGAFAGQCTGGSVRSVPWICGDTTYFWKNRYAAQYEAVYGGYKNQEGQNIFFVPFLTDENGVNTATNEPAEDPDIVAAGYYGAASRTGQLVSQTRSSHFSSPARRGIISDRLATAILKHAGWTVDFITGAYPESVGGDTGGEAGSTDNTGSTTPSPDDSGSASSPDSGDTPQGGSREAVSLRASAGGFSQQGWTFTGKSAAITDDADAEDGKAFSLTRTEGTAWSLDAPVDTDAATAAALLLNGGQIRVRFKIPDTALVENQYALGMYWRITPQPAGVAFDDSTVAKTWPNLLSVYLQTDGTNLNLMHHRSANAKLGTFGAFDNNWHTLVLKFAGNNSIQVTPVLDGTEGTPYNLANSPVASPANTLRLTSITPGMTYNLEADSLVVEVNAAAATA
ncbi:TPA: DUF1737 domain-containing protein [Escherichia coli]|nr:DUF1737 domain-containing protein [Escherichia coli]HAV9217245.1 DUF1737 domain-containing protein [Escherichia coli]